MIKTLLIVAIVAYIFRRILFTPIPGSQRHFDRGQANSKSKKKVDYTDYEEVD